MTPRLEPKVNLLVDLWYGFNAPLWWYKALTPWPEPFLPETAWTWVAEEVAL